MGVVLAKRAKVTGIFPSRDDIQKTREQARDDKIATKIRDRMIREAYALLGTTPEEIQTQEDKYREMARNNQMAGGGEIDRFNQYSALMSGHELGRRGTLKDLKNGLLTGGLAVAGLNLESILSSIGIVSTLEAIPIVGPVISAPILATVISTTIGAILTAKKLKKEDAAANANQAHDLQEAMKQLKDMKVKLNEMATQLTEKSKEWVEKYKKMKFQKAKFLKELKQEVSVILKKAGLTSTESTANAIATEIKAVVGDDGQPDSSEVSADKVTDEKTETEPRENNEGSDKIAEEQILAVEKKLADEELKKMQEIESTELGG